MPRLPTRSADIQPGAISGGRRAGPEDTGVVDLQPAVRAVQGAAEGVLQGREEDESRRVLVQQAEIRAKYAKRLDDAATSGEDLGKIREELDSDLSRVTDNLQTRKGLETAQLHSANTGAVFDNQANNIAVTRATLEARVEGAKFLNSTGAILSSNPGYLPRAEQDVDAFVATLNRVPPEKRAVIAAELKNNLNVAAAMRQAQIDPDGTIAAVKGGQYNLDPTQRLQIEREAEREKRAQEADRERVKLEARREEAERVDLARGEMLDGIIKGKVRWPDIRDNPAFAGPQGANAKKELFLMMEARNKEMASGEKRSNPVVERNLWMAIHAPDGDPRKIYSATPIFEAVQRGDINTNTANQLNAMVANQKDENNRTIGSHMNGLMAVVGRSLSQDPRYIGQPGIVAEIQMDYQDRVAKRVTALRDAKKDPMEAFNPASKDFVGSREFIQGSIDRVKGNAAAVGGVDLRAAPDQWTNVAVGQPFVDPNGNPRVMTAELQAALRKQPPAAPVATAPAPVKETANFDKYIQSRGRAGYVISVPTGRAGSAFRALEGKTYGSKEDAREALRLAIGGQ